MKFVLLVALLLAFITVQAAHNVEHKSADEIMSHLQGNNYNIYLIYFYESRATDEKTKNAMSDIENRIGDVISDNPELFYAKVDLSNPEYSRLGNVVGLTSAPAALLMVHGKGVWLSGTNGRLMLDRVKDFLPAFKQASAHHTNPY